MSVTDDPIADTREKLAGYMTLALTGAARVAEVLAHKRTRELRAAEAVSQQAAGQVLAQRRAEAVTTKHQLREAWGKGWWDTATPEQVADAYATARAYAPIDPELAGMARHMEEEIGRRYGVDADALVGDVERQAAARRAAAERGEAWVLTTEADRVDVAVRADGVVDPHERSHDVPFAESGWDDAARRETLASRLETAGIDGDARTARAATDVLQGAPAVQAAATSAATRAPRARNAPAKGAERVRGR